MGGCLRDGKLCHVCVFVIASLLFFTSCLQFLEIRLPEDENHDKEDTHDQQRDDIYKVAFFNSSTSHRG